MQKNKLGSALLNTSIFLIISLAFNIYFAFDAVSIKSGDFLLTNKRRSGDGGLVCDVYMYGKSLFGIPLLPRKKEMIEDSVKFSDGRRLTLFSEGASSD